MTGWETTERLLDSGAAKPLKDQSRLLVFNALKTIDEVLRFVEQHYCGQAPDPFDVIGALGDANSLLYVLRDGVDHRKCKFGLRQRN